VFFNKLFVAKEGISGAELTDEFGALLAEDLPKRLEKAASDPRNLRGRGSNTAYLVETAGIEPASAVAKRMASTGLAGAWFSLPASAPTGDSGKLSLLECPLAAEASRSGKPVSEAGAPPHGRGRTDSHCLGFN
jgi:hypothetical protein